MKPICIDCGKKISYGNKRCRPCWRKSCFGHTTSAETRLKISNARMGIAPWNKGKTGVYTSEHIKFLSGHGKKCVSNEFRTRGKVSQFKKGEHPWNYEGLTALHFLIRNIPEYYKWRKGVFERDRFVCQNCKISGQKIHAHHINPFRFMYADFLRQYSQFSPMEDKETLSRLALSYTPFWDIGNGLTLCEKCHKKINHMEGRCELEL